MTATTPILSFMLVHLLVFAFVALADDACDIAFDQCQFYFEGGAEDKISTIQNALDDNPGDVPFSSRILSKTSDGTTVVGVMNSNCENIIIDPSSGSETPISEFSNDFTPFQFKPFSLAQGGSGIGHETFQADGSDLIDKCVRVPFTSWQILSTSDGNVMSNVNTNDCSSINDCIAFRLPTTSPTTPPATHIVFVVDTTCPMTEGECNDYNDGIIEYLQEIKTTDTPRFGLVYTPSSVGFSGLKIALADPDYNSDAATAMANLGALLDVASFSDDCVGGFSGNDSTDLGAAFNIAIGEFESIADANAMQSFKIVVFSRCLADEGTLPCEYPTIVINGNLVEYVVVNVIGDNSGEIDESNAGTYLIIDNDTGLQCLDTSSDAIIVERSDDALTTLDQFKAKIDEFKQALSQF